MCSYLNCNRFLLLTPSISIFYQQKKIYLWLSAQVEILEEQILTTHLADFKCETKLYTCERLLMTSILCDKEIHN